MRCLHQEAGYMTASAPKRVLPFESPLTARAGPYMYQQLGGHAPALQTGSNGPHHTTMRGHGHDAAPYLRPTRDAGTPVTQRTQNLRGPDEDTSLCRVCTRGQPSHAPASPATQADAADGPTLTCHRYLAGAAARRSTGP